MAASFARPGRAGAFPRDSSFEATLATRTDASARAGTTNAAVVMVLALVGSVGTLASALRRRRLPPRLAAFTSGASASGGASGSSVAAAMASSGGVGRAGVGGGASGGLLAGAAELHASAGVVAAGLEEYAPETPLEARSTAWLQRRAAELRFRLGESE